MARSRGPTGEEGRGPGTRARGQVQGRARGARGTRRRRPGGQLARSKKPRPTGEADVRSESRSAGEGTSARSEERRVVTATGIAPTSGSEECGGLRPRRLPASPPRAPLAAESGRSRCAARAPLARRLGGRVRPLARRSPPRLASRSPLARRSRARHNARCLPPPRTEPPPAVAASRPTTPVPVQPCAGNTSTRRPTHRPPVGHPRGTRHAPADHRVTRRPLGHCRPPAVAAVLRWRTIPGASASGAPATYAKARRRDPPIRVSSRSASCPSARRASRRWGRAGGPRLRAAPRPSASSRRTSRRRPRAVGGGARIAGRWQCLSDRNAGR